MLCENGCGEDATYITKSLKHVCNKNAGKCKAINPKGKKKASRKKATIYQGNLLCEFCNTHLATHILVNGKRCCSSTAGNCKEKRKEAGKKISISRNQIDYETGLKHSELIAKKAAETKSKNVDESGLNAHKRNGIKVAEIKASDVDEFGLNAHERTGVKFRKWLESEDGRNTLREQAKKQSIRQRRIDPVLGISEAKRRAQLMVETKLNNINEFGLNGFEQSHWKAGKHTGFINGVFWQYSHERRFLERAKADGIINKVKRGPALKYEFNGEVRRYMPDYLIENSIYEIKSTYTMFGTDNKFLKRNVAKLLSAKQSGYDVYVVLDDTTISLSEFLNSISNLLK
jgi:hypothetical protein